LRKRPHRHRKTRRTKKVSLPVNLPVGVRRRNRHLRERLRRLVPRHRLKSNSRPRRRQGPRKPRRSRRRLLRRPRSKSASLHPLFRIGANRAATSEGPVSRPRRRPYRGRSHPPHRLPRSSHSRRRKNGATSEGPVSPRRRRLYAKASRPHLRARDNRSSPARQRRRRRRARRPRHSNRSRRHRPGKTTGAALANRRAAPPRRLRSHPRPRPPSSNHPPLRPELPQQFWRRPPIRPPCRRRHSAVTPASFCSDAVAVLHSRRSD
jgi:hypothetical protein